MGAVLRIEVVGKCFCQFGGIFGKFLCNPKAGKSKVSCYIVGSESNLWSDDFR
jgi:hypothetical protein